MVKDPEKILLTHEFLVYFSNEMIHENANEIQEQQRKNAIVFFPHDDYENMCFFLSKVYFNGVYGRDF